MVKISIHGSCVSRDIFRFDSKNDFEVVNYIGRNSIISLSYPSVALPVFEKIGNVQELNLGRKNDILRLQKNST